MSTSTFNIRKAVSIAALSTASVAFATSAFAGDCNMKKSQKTAQYTAAPNTAVLANTTHHGATIQYAGYGKKKDKGTIIDAAIATDSLSTLVAAVKASDLVGTLSSEGPFTVFAPTNDAFAALPAGTVETLLKPENIGQLQGILKAHVVSGKLKAKDIIQLAKDNGGTVDVTTVSGDTLTAVLAGGTLYVKDESGGLASVTTADVKKSNGVVHIVDRVLLPTDGSSS